MQMIFCQKTFSTKCELVWTFQAIVPTISGLENAFTSVAEPSDLLLLLILNLLHTSPQILNSSFQQPNLGYISSHIRCFHIRRQTLYFSFSRFDVHVLRFFLFHNFNTLNKRFCFLTFNMCVPGCCCYSIYPISPLSLSLSLSLSLLKNDRFSFPPLRVLRV